MYIFQYKEGLANCRTISLQTERPVPGSNDLLAQEISFSYPLVYRQTVVTNINLPWYADKLALYS